MKKVLIVDDEPLMRSMIKFLIDWDNLGFHICGTAYNGEEALKFLRSQHIDIIITDLKMPVLDGLELIRVTRSEKPGVKYIVLSAYDEFHLVSKAFKLGVKEYILKSDLNSEQLVQILKKVGHEIESEENEKQKNRNVKDYIDKNRSVIKEAFLVNIISGKDRIESMEQINDFHLNIEPSGHIFLITVKVMNYNRIKLETWCNDSNMLNNFLKTTLESELLANIQGEIFQYRAGEFIGISCFKNSLDHSQCVELINFNFKNAANKLASEYSIIISGGLSNKSDNPGYIKRLYTQASLANSYSFILGNGKLILYSSSMHNRPVIPFDTSEKLQKLREALHSMDSNVIIKKSSKLRIIPYHLHHRQVDNVKELFLKYHFYILLYAEQKKFFKSIEGLLNKYQEKLRYYGDLDDYNQWLDEVLLAIAKIVSDTSDNITRAKIFIDEHYSENISLTIVADKLGINSSYLSRLFIEKEKCSFSTYLAKLRTKAAIEYLENSNMKVYEIAEKVGYYNYENFSRMFKKMTGKSPSKYLL